MSVLNPASFEEDALAQGDVSLLFALLDRDTNGYLDVREAEKTREMMLAGGDTETRLMLGSMFDESDANNDGRVNEDEWRDFLRAMYEVTGRKQWMHMISGWKTQLYAEQKEVAASREMAQKAAAAKPKKKAGPKTAKRSCTEPALNDAADTDEDPEAAAQEAAATKIQAAFRGNQSRKANSTTKPPKKSRTAPLLSKAATADEARKAEMRKLASSKGLTEICVRSTDGSQGMRADFYMGGQEIPFTISDGDRGRGVQVVYIDPDTERVQRKVTYDTCPPQHRAECARLSADLHALPEGTLVLIAVKGYGVKDLNAAAVKALNSCLGATAKCLGKQDAGWAIIAIKGAPAVAEQSGLKVEIDAFVSFEKIRKRRAGAPSPEPE